MLVEVFVRAWPSVASWIRDNNERLSRAARMDAFMKKRAVLALQRSFDEWYMSIPPEQWQLHVLPPLFPLWQWWQDTEAQLDMLLLFATLTRGASDEEDDEFDAEHPEIIPLLALEDEVHSTATDQEPIL